MDPAVRCADEFSEVLANLRCSFGETLMNDS